MKYNHVANGGLRCFIIAYLIVAMVSMGFGFTQSPFPAPGDSGPSVQLRTAIPGESLRIAWRNTQTVLALTAGNIFTFGVYGIFSMAFNGYLVGRVATTVAQRDRHVLSIFSAYAIRELAAFYLTAVASAMWVHSMVLRPIGWRACIQRAAWIWVMSLGLVVAAAILEAVAIWRINT